MMKCALTGHRELSASLDQNALYDALEELIKAGYTAFCCGMAEGFDLLALECLVSLRRKYRIFLEACIPYEGQENSFSFSQRKRYRELIGWCDKRTVLSKSYHGGCYLVRNRYMVDQADLVFAYCNKDTGGTAYTVNYARDRGVEVRLFRAEK